MFCTLIREIVVGGTSIRPIVNCLAETKKIVCVTVGVYFLVAFSYSRKAPLSLVMPVGMFVCASICSHRTTFEKI